VGVTIHFEGRLLDQATYASAVELARGYAIDRGWRTEPIDESCVTLQRVRDEEDWDYTGPTRGLVLYPHDDCDPVRLEFDIDLYVQEFVKTQFASEAVHVDVIGLLRLLAPCFESLQVADEGGFWDTQDLGVLRQHRRAFEVALQDQVGAHPTAKVKVKLRDGRIVDLMT
jgi:hypothetical protein